MALYENVAPLIYACPSLHPPEMSPASETTVSSSFGHWSIVLKKVTSCSFPESCLKQSEPFHMDAMRFLFTMVLYLPVQVATLSDTLGNIEPLLLLNLVQNSTFLLSPFSECFFDVTGAVS